VNVGRHGKPQHSIVHCVPQQGAQVLGAVVNVPIPVSNIVTFLPRALNEAEVLQLHLKRRIEYGHDFMAETIRPPLLTLLDTY